MLSDMKQDKAAQEAIIAGFNNLRQVVCLCPLFTIINEQFLMQWVNPSFGWESEILSDQCGGASYKIHFAIPIPSPPFHNSIETWWFRNIVIWNSGLNTSWSKKMLLFKSDSNGSYLMRQEQRSIATKTNELQQDLNEHNIVIETLNGVDGDRKCFRYRSS